MLDCSSVKSPEMKQESELSELQLQSRGGTKNLAGRVRGRNLQTGARGTQ